jgi:uncharacterized protein YegP (UPF0339 family)
MAKSKKPVKVPAGIYLKGTPGNISVHIHAANGNKLAVLRGYNNRANAQKGIHALVSVLDDAAGLITSDFDVIDLVKKPKPVARVDRKARQKA